MKVLNDRINEITADANVRKVLTEKLSAIPQSDASGGMTVDLGNGPVVVCYGKMTLVDEKALRVDLRRTIGDKVNLSRTNNVKVRCAQYDVAETAADWRKMFGAEKAKEKKPESTPPVQGPVEKSGKPPTVAPVK